MSEVKDWHQDVAIIAVKEAMQLRDEPISGDAVVARAAQALADAGITDPTLVNERLLAEATGDLIRENSRLRTNTQRHIDEAMAAEHEALFGVASRAGRWYGAAFGSATNDKDAQRAAGAVNVTVYIGLIVEERMAALAATLKESPYNVNHPQPDSNSVEPDPRDDDGPVDVPDDVLAALADPDVIKKHYDKFAAIIRADKTADDQGGG